MQPFRVYILGCGSALPTTKHFASSQIVVIRDKQFMIDCGEGTQIQLRRLHIPFTRIQAVFISHLHGDHCFGLIGMISTFGMLGRKSPLKVYAPADFGNLLRKQINIFCPSLEYDVLFCPVDTSVKQIIYEDRSLSVTTIPLEHRIPCCGFLFKEKATLPHIRRDMIDFLDIPLSQINNIKNGAGWMPTLYQSLLNTNVLYHESTYCNDREDNARLYFHSTAEQAAKVARDAKVKKLILGHFSARYNDEEQLLKEAKAIFPYSSLANEGEIIEIT